MKADEIELFCDYNYWANGRIVATCARVSREQYDADTSFGNLRATVVHILDDEWSWRLAFGRLFVPAERLQGSSPPPALDWDNHHLTAADLPTLAALQARWQGEEQAMRAYLNTLSDADLNGFVRYGIPGGIVCERLLWHCLLNLVNHGTQHRSEAAALLTSYGQSPGELDFTGFLNEHFHLPLEPPPAYS